MCCDKINSPLEGHLWVFLFFVFQFWATTNQAAVNICVQVYIRTVLFFFLLDIYLGSGMPGFYGRCIKEIVSFPKCLYHFHSASRV